MSEDGPKKKRIRCNYTLDLESLGMLKRLSNRRKAGGFMVASRCSRSAVVRDAIRMLYEYEVERHSFEHPKG